MSQTEIHIGTLNQVKKLNSLKELIDWANEKNMSPQYYDSIEYYLNEYGDNDKVFNKQSILFTPADEPEEYRYIYFNKALYEFAQHQEPDDFDINVFNKSTDGNIQFVTAFHNGGTCLSEAIERGLKQLG